MCLNSHLRAEWENTVFKAAITQSSLGHTRQAKKFCSTTTELQDNSDDP